MKEYIIEKNEAGQRFDKYIFKLLKNAGTGLIFKQLRNKNIVLNGKKAKGNEILKENDSVRIFMSDDTINKFTGGPLHISKTGFRLDVIYEDDDILLASKPVGVLSQKSSDKDISMNEYLIEYLTDNGFGKENLATFKPSFCNRLDRNTSGLMIAGKSLRGLQKMSEIIKDRSIHKFYLTIVKGKVDKKSVIKGYLRKDEKNNKVVIYDNPVKDGYEIHTEYEPLATKDDMTLLKVRLITGKTHQIRAHLAGISHPVLGDFKYGDKVFNEKYGEKKQLLHSYQVVFPKLDDFPDISEKSFNTPYPVNFTKYFKEN